MQRKTSLMLSIALAGLIAIAIPTLARAASDEGIFVISAGEAPLYRTPQDGGKTAQSLKRGRRVQAAGPVENGYLPLSIRSGGKVWIRAADATPQVTTRDVSAAEVLEPGATERPAAADRRERRQAEHGARAPSSLGLEKITFDLGAGTGSVGGLSYTEIDLGLNLYFAEWLAWRNALFGRFMSGVESIYGLDTSVRGILNLDGGALGMTAFAGPGYRFVNKGENVPLAEAGLVIRLAGFAIGGGAKTLLTSWVHSGAPNDTQVFLILSGGGSL